MNNIDWASVYPEFKPTENWGDLSVLQPAQVYALYDFRKYINSPIVISCGTQGVHASGSDHYRGYATDNLFPGFTMKELFDLYTMASRFPKFTGIGLYLYWKLNNKVVPGMHLETGPRPIRKLWIKIKIKGVVTEYALTAENLKWMALI